MLFSRKKYKNRQLKKWEWIFLAIVLLLFIGLKIYYARWPKAVIKIDNSASSVNASSTIASAQEFKVLVANTNARRVAGWSNKKDMGRYNGMLFIFPAAGQQTMVMRDMNFALDIIWFAGQTIVDMAPNTPPEPNKNESQLTPYFSRLPADKVLELPAGFVKQNIVKIGDRVEINYP